MDHALHSKSIIKSILLPLLNFAKKFSKGFPLMASNIISGKESKLRVGKLAFYT